MKVGITLPESGQDASRENIIQMAKEAENEGFDSLWVWERLMWPLKPQTAYPRTPDGSHPIDFQNVFDPLETLIFVAANTRKIALGTSVIDMLFHNPIVLARRFATLDIFSKGRAICGLGIGWMKDEYQASNIPFQDRGKRADECIQVLKQIWMNEVVEFDGEFYKVPASKIGPKPLQKPHPPIYLGGFHPNTFRRIVKYDTNGWLPVVGGGLPLDYIENNMKAISDTARKANKDPEKFKSILLTYPEIIDTSSGKYEEKNQRAPMTGTIDEIGNDIKRIKDFGVDHIIFSLPIGRDISKVIDISKQLSRFAK